jgi:sulfonate transport system permease protein
VPGSGTDGAGAGAGTGSGADGTVAVAEVTNPTKGGPTASGTVSPRWRRAVLGAVIPVILLVIWALVTNSGMVAQSKLPTPQSVFSAGADLFADGTLMTHIGISVQRVLLGFVIGSVLGLVVGSLVGLSRVFSELFSPLIGALRAVPSLAWVPLLLIWLHYGENSKVTLVAIGAFFPVFTTVASGLRHVDAHLVEAARAFGYSGFRLLRTVQLPAVVPSIFSGLRLALAQAWLFLVAAELLGASMGLGFLLTDSQNNGRTDRLILAIILLAVLGKITDALLGVVERWAERRWT